MPNRLQVQPAQAEPQKDNADGDTEDELPPFSQKTHHHDSQQIPGWQDIGRDVAYLGPTHPPDAVIPCESC